MKIKNQIANIITSIRIIGAIVLCFLEPLKTPFFIVFTFCGLSDAVDGFCARKLGIVSEFGSKLDSMADLSFYTVMMVKIFGYLIKNLNYVNWVLLILVLIIRLSAYFVSAFRFKKFASVHSVLNKITGFGVFALPYFTLINPMVFNVYATCVVLVSICGSMSELITYLTKKSI